MFVCIISFIVDMDSKGVMRHRIHGSVYTWVLVVTVRYVFGTEGKIKAIQKCFQHGLICHSYYCKS